MIGMLDSSGIAENCSLVLEKPFGHDAKSACELNAALGEMLPEREIYRIDHFLGKEAVLDLLALLHPRRGRARAAVTPGRRRTSPGAPQGLRGDPGPSIRRGPCSASTRATTRRTTSRPTRGSRPSLRWRCWSTRGDGAGCRSTCEPARRWPRRGARVTLGLSDTPLELFPGRRDGDAILPDEIVIELSDDPVVRVDVRVKSPGRGLDLASAPFVLDVDRALGTDNGLEAYERLLHDVMTGDRLCSAPPSRSSGSGRPARRSSSTRPNRSRTRGARGGPGRRSHCPGRAAGGCPTTRAAERPDTHVRPRERTKSAQFAGSGRMF